MDGLASALLHERKQERFGVLSAVFVLLRPERDRVSDRVRVSDRARVQCSEPGSYHFQSSAEVIEGQHQCLSEGHCDGSELTCRGEKKHEVPEVIAADKTVGSSVPTLGIDIDAAVANENELSRDNWRNEYEPSCAKLG